MNIQTKLTKIFEILSRTNEPTEYLDILESLEMYLKMNPENKNNILLPNSLGRYDLFNCRFIPELDKLIEENKLNENAADRINDEIGRNASEIGDIITTFDFDDDSGNEECYVDEM